MAQVPLQPQLTFDEKKAEPLRVVPNHLVSLSFHQPIVSENRKNVFPSLFGIEYGFGDKYGLWMISAHIDLNSESASVIDSGYIKLLQAGIAGRYYLMNEATGLFTFFDLTLGDMDWKAPSPNPLLPQIENSLLLMPSLGLGYGFRLVTGTNAVRALRNHFMLNVIVGIGTVYSIGSSKNTVGIKVEDAVSFGPSSKPFLVYFRLSAGFSFTAFD
ncbi:MAG: hypothetical protein SFU91_07820 [Chloroherpetonaceae bacterium]|nr:hypothetical protein [Chloroherpetonaceae bacterium]